MPGGPTNSHVGGVLDEAQRGQLGDEPGIDDELGIDGRWALKLKSVRVNVQEQAS